MVIEYLVGSTASIFHDSEIYGEFVVTTSEGAERKSHACLLAKIIEKHKIFPRLLIIKYSCSVDYPRKERARVFKFNGPINPLHM